MTPTSQVFQELELHYDPDNLYVQTMSSILDAAERVDLPHQLKLILAQPKNEIMVHFPVQMDDGTSKLFKGYRVQHNNVLGPYKGGIRFHDDVRLDHVKSLAVLMTMKCALLRLPYGGGKGGLQVTPRELSNDELRRVTRRFTSALGVNIGPNYDIPAPDVGTNGQIMAWMADTYMNLHMAHDRFHGRSVVTGKPLDFGGSKGREKATGQGLVYVLEKMLPEMGFDLSNLTYSLLGFGNVGSWTGRLLQQHGATLVAVMDHTGALCNKNGIDAKLLARYVNDAGGVAGYTGADTISEDEFYETQVDLFIPAALEQMIDESRAKQIHCHVLAEAANAPVTPAGERYLVERGVKILPAILCNSGGVTVSYFEWKQNRQAETWSLAVVDRELCKQMSAAVRRVVDISKRYHVDMRLAAYGAALDYIRKVYDLRGIFP